MTFLKSSRLILTALLLNAASSFADNPQLQTLISNQRAQGERTSGATVAVYARERSFGIRVVESRSTTDQKVELKKGRGQTLPLVRGTR